MLPVVRGVPETTRQILLYSFVLFAITLLLYPVARLGPAVPVRPRSSSGGDLHLCEALVLRRERTVEPRAAPVPLLEHLPRAPLRGRRRGPPRARDPLAARGEVRDTTNATDAFIALFAFVALAAADSPRCVAGSGLGGGAGLRRGRSVAASTLEPPAAALAARSSPTTCLRPRSLPRPAARAACAAISGRPVPRAGGVLLAGRGSRHGPRQRDPRPGDGRPRGPPRPPRDPVAPAAAPFVVASADLTSVLASPMADGRLAHPRAARRSATLMPSDLLRQRRRAAKRDPARGPAFRRAARGSETRTGVTSAPGRRASSSSSRRSIRSASIWSWRIHAAATSTTATSSAMSPVTHMIAPAHC